MPADSKTILEAALALPAIDRAAIVESLLASLDQLDPAVDECWAFEAERRLTALKAGQIEAISADVVFDELDDLWL